ncbi:MAG: hypothetical protein IPP34_18615 [Bacteroidetes bacterium]|nr:hypothetical protein [Bacteroidota bacterium]
MTQEQGYPLGGQVNGGGFNPDMGADEGDLHSWFLLHRIVQLMMRLLTLQQMFVHMVR